MLIREKKNNHNKKEANKENIIKQKILRENSKTKRKYSPSRRIIITDSGGRVATVGGGRGVTGVGVGEPVACKGRGGWIRQPTALPICCGRHPRHSLRLYQSRHKTGPHHRLQPPAQHAPRTRPPPTPNSEGH